LTYNDNNKVKNALVIGSHVQSLGIVRSLGRSGIKVILLTTTSFSIAKYSKYPTKIYNLNRKLENKKIVKSIITLVINKKIEGCNLYCTEDWIVELVSNYRNLLGKFANLNLPSKKAVNIALDKYKTYSFCISNKIATPNTFLFNKIEEITAHSSSINFPVIVKPRVMHNFFNKIGKKALLCNNLFDLKKNFSLGSKVVGSRGLIVQEIIPGNFNELYSFCSISQKGKVYASLIAKRERQHPIDFGSGTTFARTIINSDIEKESKKIIKKLEYTGPSEIEFKFDAKEKKFKFLEINIRFWKWHTIGEASGFDFPILFHDLTSDKEITFQEHYESGIIWSHTLVDFLNFIMIKIKEEKRTNFTSSPLDYNISAVYSKEDKFPQIMEILMLPLILWERRIGSAN